MYNYILLTLIIFAAFSACSNWQRSKPEGTTFDSQQQSEAQLKPEASPENIHSNGLKTDLAYDLTSMPAKVTSFMPDGWKIYDKVMEFTPENLYELIDGGAELYLAYDMVKMLFVNFVHKTNMKLSIELYIYDMGTPTNAFGIFSAERFQTAPSLSFGRASFNVDAHYFIWNGRYYIRIIASDFTEELKQVGLNIARKVTPCLYDSGEPVWGLTALPHNDLIPGSVRYFKVDAMSLNFMRDTYTAKYLKDNTEIIAFLSKQESPESAQATVARYVEHTKRYGERTERMTQNGMEFVLCDMGGSFDIIFQRGRLVGGVISVADRTIAAQAAVDFRKQIRSE
jgi:hypothetical protein